jgi:uncharacterized membrane protein YeaQ/YmgE (transglycosylase-associated protein family)
LNSRKFQPDRSLLIEIIRQVKEKTMSIITWTVLGLIAGFITSKLINKTGEGVVMDVVLGICGAVVGGAIFNRLGMAGVTGFNIWSLLVSVSGASLLLVAYHALQGTFKRAG